MSRVNDAYGTAHFRQAEWLISALCGGGSCVEIAFLADGFVGIRDSKFGTVRGSEGLPQPTIVLTGAEWAEFTQSVLSVGCGTDVIEVIETADEICFESRGITLSYTTEEWDAFQGGLSLNAFVASQI